MMLSIAGKNVQRTMFFTPARLLFGVVVVVLFIDAAADWGMAGGTMIVAENENTHGPTTTAR